MLIVLNRRFIIKQENKKQLTRIAISYASFVPPFLTKMVSSPITTISFQQTTISSPFPQKPKTPLPQKTVILTKQPVQVSISTSVTHPRRQPLSTFTTSFARKSVTVHLKKEHLSKYQTHQQKGLYFFLQYDIFSYQP